MVCLPPESRKRQAREQGGFNKHLQCVLTQQLMELAHQERVKRWLDDQERKDEARRKCLEQRNHVWQSLRAQRFSQKAQSESMAKQIERKSREEASQRDKHQKELFERSKATLEQRAQERQEQRKVRAASHQQKIEECHKKQRARQARQEAAIRKRTQEREAKSLANKRKLETEAQRKRRAREAKEGAVLEHHKKLSEMRERHLRAKRDAIEKQSREAEEKALLAKASKAAQYNALLKEKDADAKKHRDTVQTKAQRTLQRQQRIKEVRPGLVLGLFLRLLGSWLALSFPPFFPYQQQLERDLREKEERLQEAKRRRAAEQEAKKLAAQERQEELLRKREKREAMEEERRKRLEEQTREADRRIEEMKIHRQQEKADGRIRTAEELRQRQQLRARFEKIKLRCGATSTASPISLGLIVSTLKGALEEKSPLKASLPRGAASPVPTPPTGAAVRIPTAPVLKKTLRMRQKLQQEYNAELLQVLEEEQVAEELRQEDSKSDAARAAEERLAASERIIAVTKKYEASLSELDGQ
ncbi:unnamed protein product [Chrysoparadoxa australica]